MLITCDAKVVLTNVVVQHVGRPVSPFSSILNTRLFSVTPSEPRLLFAFMCTQGAQLTVCNAAHSYACSLIICTIAFLKRSRCVSVIKWGENAPSTKGGLQYCSALYRILHNLAVKTSIISPPWSNLKTNTSPRMHIESGSVLYPWEVIGCVYILLIILIIHLFSLLAVNQACSGAPDVQVNCKLWKYKDSHLLQR